MASPKGFSCCTCGGVGGAGPVTCRAHEHMCFYGDCCMPSWLNMGFQHIICFMRNLPHVLQDDAFINSGTDLQWDTLFVMFPGTTCQERNLTYQ